MSNLRNVKLSFGEEKASPIFLDNDDIDLIIKLIEDENVNTTFSGFINSEYPIKASNAYLLKINGISYLGKLTIDNYSVTASSNNVKENEEVVFTAEGISNSLLVYSIDSITSDNISIEEVNNICSIKNNKLIIGKSSSINRWTATLVIRVNTIYDSVESKTITINLTGEPSTTKFDIIGDTTIKGYYDEIISTDFILKYDVVPKNEYVKSIEFICDDPYVNITNTSINGFTVQCLGKETKVPVLVKIHYKDVVIENSIIVDFVFKQKIIIPDTNFICINGEKEQYYRLEYTPGSLPIAITSVTTNDNNIKVKDITTEGFTLYSTTYNTESKKLTITIVYTVDQEVTSVSKTILAINKNIILNFSLYKDNNWITGDSIVKIGNLYADYEGQGYWSINKNVDNEDKVLLNVSEVVGINGTLYNLNSEYKLFINPTINCQYVELISMTRTNYGYPRNVKITKGLPEDVNVIIKESTLSSGEASVLFSFSRKLTVTELNNIYCSAEGTSGYTANYAIEKIHYCNAGIPITINNEHFEYFTGDKDIYSDGSEETQHTESLIRHSNGVHYSRQLPENAKITSITLWYTSGLYYQGTVALSSVPIPSSSSEYVKIASFSIRINTPIVLTTFSQSVITSKPYITIMGSYDPSSGSITYITTEYAPRPFEIIAIDLGLPSGVKWANANIGANAEEDAGLYFQWGDTEGHKKDSGYSFKYSNYQAKGLNSISANLTLEQDAARANMGGSWRMPTKAEFEELYRNTNVTWTTINDVAGRKFANKTDASKYIFMPAAGYYNNTSLELWGSSGYYWSSLFYSGSYAYHFRVGTGGQSTDYHYRECGSMVRGVC